MNQMPLMKNNPSKDSKSRGNALIPYTRCTYSATRDYYTHVSVRFLAQNG